MSGEESTSRSGTSQSGGASIPYDYGYGDKKSDSGKVPRFNGDPEEFSWWKTNFIVMSWVLMNNYGTYWKTVLVT